MRLSAADALGRYEAAGRLSGSEARVAVALVQSLHHDIDPVVRGRAAISLAAFAGSAQAPDVAAALRQTMLSERNVDVRRRAMWTIYRRYALVEPRSALDAGLHDPDDTVRIEAVRAYGRLQDRTAIKDLRPLLADRSWRVAEQTWQSIRLIEGDAPTTAWTAIPAPIKTPAPVRDRLAALPALRPKDADRPASPRVDDAALFPQLDPKTAAQMTQPAPGPHPRVRIVTTKGNIYVVLYPEWAPMTTLNFLNLAAVGFYDGNRWFRIVPDFVVQTGEKDDKRAPGPGYSIRAEENPLEQNAYVLSMGLNYDKTQAPLRDSAGSEYYITLSPQYHLDNDFTVFGSVSSGFDVLGRLVESDRVVRVERIADATL